MFGEPRMLRSTIARLATFALAMLIASPAIAADDASAKLRTSLDKALGFLKSKQQADGTWQSSPRDPPGLSALVLRSFANDKSFGAKQDFVKKGYDALLKIQKPDGGIYTDMLANYNTAIAISALAAAAEADPTLKPHIDKAVAYLKGIQIKDNEKDPSNGGVSYGGKGRDGKPARADLS